MHIIKKVKDANPKEITCGIMRSLVEEKDFSGMSIIHVVIKNDKTKKHFHKKLTEVYYILKGEISIEVDGKIEHLKEGQMIMIFPKTEHRAWKTGKEDAEILVICCPAWAKEDEVLVE